MYLSGVMFPLDRYLTSDKTGDLIPRLIALNPLVGIINLYRWALMGTPLVAGDVVKVLVISGLILMSGFWYFRLAESRYGRA